MVFTFGIINPYTWCVILRVLYTVLYHIISCQEKRTMETMGIKLQSYYKWVQENTQSYPRNQG